MGWFWEDKDSDGSPGERLYVQKKLHSLYKNHVVPLERQYKYSKFATPELREADFLAPPIVMCLGQYSTGKTSVIEYLVKAKLPGAHIGPEPTTDRFCAYMFGDEERIIPGHAACSEEGLPFKALQHYGSTFLGKFEVAQLPAPLLKDVTFVDTPGVLSGEKQRENRGYDFAAVTRHFAERADRILLLFDCSKLDISDELKEVIHSLEGNQDKVRCLLNKADHVDSKELFRVYGALLWSLSRAMDNPEVLRVFVGSMRDGPYRDVGAEYTTRDPSDPSGDLRDHGAHGQAGPSVGAALDAAAATQNNHRLFDLERAALLADLEGLPRDARVRKVNETMKRFRAAKAHALLCTHLRQQFGWKDALMSNAAKQTEVLMGLDALQGSLARRHGLNASDFVPALHFKRVVKDLGVELWKWPEASEEELDAVEKAVASSIHPLLALASEPVHVA